MYTVNNIAVALFDDGGNPRQVYTFENYTGDWYNVRIEFNSSTSKVKIYIDNEYKTEVDLSIYTMTTYGFRFVDWQSDMDMKIKELKIYPI